MISLTLFGNIARNAVIGTISSKVIDSFVSSRINNKVEQKRWLRMTRLELFSQLSHNIIGTEEEFLLNIKKTQSTLSKIILLLDDSKLIQTINDYLYILQEYENAKEHINLSRINTELITTLSRHIQKL